jgi:hypothetical protein
VVGRLCLIAYADVGPRTPERQGIIGATMMMFEIMFLVFAVIALLRLP